MKEKITVSIDKDINDILKSICKKYNAHVKSAIVNKILRDYLVYIQTKDEEQNVKV